MRKMSGKFARTVLIAIPASSILIAGLVLWELMPEVRVARKPTAMRSVQMPLVPFASYIDLYIAYVTDDGTIYAMSDHYVFISTDHGETFQRRGKLPKARSSFFTTVKDVVARSKLIRSLRRVKTPNNLVVLPSGTILVFYDQIYRSSDDGWTFEAVYNLKENGVYLPFGGNEGVTISPKTHHVYFGEYNCNARPHPIRIFRGSNDGTLWEEIFAFPAGQIFHVHSMQYDIYRDRLWILTGDRDTEANIFWTDEEEFQPQCLGGGSQKWRAVSMIIRENDLVWGSDNDRNGASIYRWDFASQHLLKLQTIGKVSYFSTSLSHGMLILSTTHEPHSEYTKRFNPDATTDLWISNDGGNSWQMVLSMPHLGHVTKQGFLSRASMAFPSGVATRDLYINFFSTIKGPDQAWKVRMMQSSPDLLTREVSS